MSKLIITLDKEHATAETAYRVAGMIEEGFTSGIDPTFEIVEGDKPIPQAKNHICECGNEHEITE